MTKLQIAFGLVTVALLCAILFVQLGAGKAFGMVNPNDPSITNLTRLSLSSGSIILAGVEQVDQRTSALNQASTTACSFTTPAATSTLDRISGLFTTGSTTASTITIATSTAGGSASTTPLMSFSLAANAQGTFVFEPTTTDKLILAPSTGVVITMTGGTGTFSPAGVCTTKTTLLN